MVALPNAGRTSAANTNGQSDLAAPSVLVVEDNLDIRQALEDLLSQEGYVVECAADGAAALRLLRTGLRPRAILLDMMMQGMNGERFREEQLADPVLAEIPVVIISANRRATEQAVAGGAVAGITKPFRFENLRRVLEQCTSSARR